MRRIVQLVLLAVWSGLAGCGGGSQNLSLGNNTPGAPIGIGGSEGSPIQYAPEFPRMLPKDAIQPWEQLGSAGNVELDFNRGASATGASTEFYEGPQTYLESGDTADWNGALRLGSGAVGDGNLSYAMYRIPLGGSEPGVVSVDANLRPMGDGNPGSYWVGLADYGSGSWQWFGPITDAHWRISTVQAARESASYTSGVGSVFVCVVAHDGAVVDIVGVGVDPVDSGDTTAPDAPGGLVLTPVASGLDLNWGPVGGSDVAGYKVYYKDKAFGEYTAKFANTLQGLQGRRFILDLSDEPIQEWWIAVTAIDKSGNESALGVISHSTPVVGIAPELDLEITSYSVMRGELVSLTASGADLYDWDLDGDGIFDILGDNTGTADVDTSQTGLIRPLVRGTGADSTSVAMSAVSVIVTSNSRPVAVANATPASGNAPLDVAFSGTDSTDFDGTIVGGGWDFDGDGFYDVWEDLDIVHVTSAGNTFAAPGVYNAKLRVVDNEGAWDVDTLAVVVSPAPDPANTPPIAALIADVASGDAPLTVELYAGGSTDGDGTIVEYAWDYDGDGVYDGFSEGFTVNHTYTAPGIFNAKVRVEDNDGARGTATVAITVNVVGNELPIAGLTATPQTGNFPIEIDFDAQGSSDPDGTIVRYDWDFNGDDNFELYDGGDSPDWTYTSAGVFNAQVKVTDDAGAQATATVEVIVSSPPVAILQGSPLTGQASINVAFNAADSYDPDGSIEDFEWDFDGDNTYNETGAEADSQGEAAPLLQTYAAGQPVVVHLRVTDNDGATDIASITISVHGWVTVRAIDLGSPAGADSFCESSLALVSGQPAIGYQDYDNGRLLYSRALDAYGTAWSDSPVVADGGAGDTVGGSPSLAVVSGTPAIGYSNATALDLKYVRASDAVGDIWGTPLTLDSDGSTGYSPSLLVVDGNPAIGYNYDFIDVKYVRAIDATGTSWGTPITVDSQNIVGIYLSMTLVDGNPAISSRYWDSGSTNVRYVRASDVAGSTWGTPVEVNAPTTGANHTSIAVINGFPAIAYAGPVDGLRYVRATDAQGSAWGTPVPVVDSSDAGEFNSLTTVNGKPAICSSGNGFVWYIESLDSVGSSWDTRYAIDFGSRGSMIEVDRKPAISYNDLDFPTSNEIKYAIRY